GKKRFTTSSTAFSIASTLADFLFPMSIGSNHPELEPFQLLQTGPGLLQVFVQKPTQFTSFTE
ncbi:hypothetical protein KBD68_04750, partial [Candidatus Woesebacteria bacterium]|nr:hypothetical protein [Candidatus Woesebacteria bacterium]